MFDYWLRQEKPLFTDLLWSRPENRNLAGKLLIVGGNAFGFAAPAEAYAEAGKAGVGVARVVLPDALHRTVGNVFEAGDFAPSNPSGSFSQKALNDFLIHANWADATLIAGDLGRNSETAILLESFVTKHAGLIIITKDAADYFTSTPRSILSRPDTTLVISFAQLQRLAINAHVPQAFTFDMGLVKLVGQLQDFTTHFQPNVVVKYVDQLIVAVGGEVSTTTLAAEQEVWRVRTAARASVWWLQNPSKPFAALTTAAFESAQ